VKPVRDKEGEFTGKKGEFIIFLNELIEINSFVPPCP
jgi:hypothetical protein